MSAPYEFDPTAARPRKALAITTIRRSKRKDIDPAIVAAAVMFLHKKGMSYDRVSRNLKASGHTQAEAEAICDACFFPQP